MGTVDALELIPTKNQILLRLAGNEDAQKPYSSNNGTTQGLYSAAKSLRMRQTQDGLNFREFSWTGGEDWILKVPLTPSSVFKT